MAIPLLKADQRLKSGDFFDDLVDSTIRVLISQLKAEYKFRLEQAILEVETQAVEGNTSLEAQTALRQTAAIQRPEGKDISDLLEGIPGQPDHDTEKPLSQKPPLEHSASDVPAAAHDPLDDENEKTSTNTSSLGSAPPQDGTETRTSIVSPFKGLFRRISARADRLFSKEEVGALRDLRKEQMQKEKDLKSKFRRSGTVKLDPNDLSDAHWTKRWSAKAITNKWFDYIIGVFICFNALTIGLETSHSVHLREIPAWLHVCEYIFLVIFSAELTMRFSAFGVRDALKSHWVKFDALMVVAGVLNFMFTVVSLGGESTQKIIGNVNMVKMIRLVRLARTVRLVVQFRTLWLLVQGLMGAMLPMLYTAGMMLVVIYFFAVVGMEAIVNGSTEAEYSDVATVRFNSVWNAMLTLMQFMLLDSAESVWWPLVAHKPILIFYFVCYFLMGPIALMNIVTAIMVESSLRTANEDMDARKAWEDMKRKALKPRLIHLFHLLDADASGDVDLKEIMQGPEDLQEQLRQIVDLDDLVEIFNMLDVDGSGGVSIDEFVDGIMRSQTDKPSELTVIIKQGKSILQQLQGHPTACSA